MSGTSLVNGTVSLISGDLLGAIVDRIIVAIGKRARIIDKLNLGSESTSLLDALAGLVFQVGFLSVGTGLLANGLPFIQTDVSALTLYILGLWSSSTTLKDNLRILNSILLMEGDYKKITETKDRENVPATTTTVPSASSTTH